MGTSHSQPSLAQFAGQNYISLMTFRKNGEGVATPVWFAEQEGVFFVYSVADAGKIKRIRNNSQVKVAPCDARGRLRGEWTEGTARLLEGEEARRANGLLDAKYGWQRHLLNFFARFRSRPRAYLAIRPGPNGSSREG
jgi:uncharacterized protein